MRARCARARGDKVIAEKKPTIPSPMGEEKAANPFLRADVPEVAKAVGLAGQPAWQVFAEIRERKNTLLNGAGQWSVRAYCASFAHSSACTRATSL